MSRSALVGWAALSGALAVMAGAFGAHGASGPAAEWLRTGAQYQMVHAAAALAVVGRFRRVAACWLGGAALFAGSLYLLAIGGPRWIGIVTPFGGLGLIAGWIGLAWAAFRETRSLETHP